MTTTDDDDTAGPAFIAWPPTTADEVRRAAVGNLYVLPPPMEGGDVHPLPARPHLEVVKDDDGDGDPPPPRWASSLDAIPRPDQMNCRCAIVPVVPPVMPRVSLLLRLVTALALYWRQPSEILVDISRPFRWLRWKLVTKPRIDRLVRKAAETPEMEVAFGGTPGRVIPAGTVVHLDGARWATLETIVIGNAPVTRARIRRLPRESVPASWFSLFFFAACCLVAPVVVLFALWIAS